MQSQVKAGKISDKSSFDGSANIEAHIQSTRNRLDATLGSLAEMMSPDHIVHTLATPLGESGKAMAKKAARSIQENPLPLVVMAAGLAWFVTSTSSRRDRDRTGMVWVPERYGSTGEPRGLNRVPDRIAEAKDSIGDRLGQLGEEVAGTMNRARDMASSTQASVSRNASRLAHGAERRMHQAADQAAGMKNEASSYFQQYPIALGAIGLAVGSFIGGMLPRTDKEDELFGQHRDQLRDSTLERVSASARQFEETAKESASEAVASAKQTLGSDTGTKLSPS